MTLRAIFIGLFSILLVTVLGGQIQDHTQQSYCTWRCHDHGCPHSAAIGPSFLPRRWSANRLENQATGWLHAMPFSYRQANLIVYGALVPLMALLLSIWWWNWYIAIGTGISVALFALHPEWYNLCTEFCIHLGNWTGLSYSGNCFWLFLVGIPLVLFFDGVATVITIRKRFGRSLHGAE